jgi:hypothetical protein
MAKRKQGIESGIASGIDTKPQDTKTTPETETQAASPQDMGNIPPTIPAAAPHATGTRETSVASRFMREKRWWGDIELVRNQLMKDARKTMDKPAAQAWVYAELDRLYPPLGSDERTLETPMPPRVAPQDGRVQGLGDIPWKDLPANASLAAEVSWVQSNRLYIVEELASGAVRVHLDKAHEPPPSRAALGWLETSIRAYAKYVDVAARATQGQSDEAEHVRRERLAIEDMRELLRSMKPVCPACGASLM